MIGKSQRETEIPLDSAEWVLRINQDKPGQMELALKQTQLSARPTNRAQDLDPLPALQTEREKPLTKPTGEIHSSLCTIVWRSLLATDERRCSTRLGGQKANIQY
jgi:hypothetical protein